MDTHDPCVADIDLPSAGRRTFLRWLSAIFGTIAAAFLGVPVIGYFLGLRKRTVFWVDLGDVTAFPLNQTRRIDFDNPLRQPWDGVTALAGVYVRNEGQGEEGADQFRVLSVNCAHLGCPVTWFQQSGLFMCPCHGGVYYADGQRASGPPPRGLFHCVWRVENGRLQVQAPHYPTLQDTLTENA
jgi:menaquinol-cytochrome c reductase iron-sulfur subunit